MTGDGIDFNEFRRPARPGAARDAGRDATEPAANGRVLVDPACSAGEHEECRLKGILGIVMVVEHSTAHRPYDRTVPGEQHAKRLLIGAGGKAPHEIPVGCILGSDRTADEPYRACPISPGH
jgi:hypothetical protein